jgi:molecular chaperone DnaK
LGEEVTEAIITVPAYFTDPQRQATRDAATIAGFDVLRILNEPTAAALAYAQQRKESARIAIYDFGGGTFDISLVSVSGDVAQVLSTRGNNALGGNDLDQRIVEWLLEELKAAEGVDASNDNVVLQRLKDAAERAKIDLSAADSAAIYLPFLIADDSGPKHLQTTLARAKLEELAGDLFQETIDECRRALEDANLEPSAIDEVILVGGSSRIPKVQQMVSDLFGRTLNKSVNPEEVVAVGAAVHASMLQGDTSAVTLLDVTNFSLGLEVEGRRFAPLIPKNTAIPAHATRMVSTVTENQKTVRIHILQGESPKSDDNVSLGEFELSGIPDAPRGVPRIEVRFGIDTNGIVQVTAIEKSTGTEHEIVIDNPIGLGQSKLDAIKKRVEGGTLDGTAPSA